VKTILQLRADGLTSEDSVLSARSAEMESQLKVANIEVQTQDLKILDVRREQAELQTQSRLGDLELQLLQLPLKLKQTTTQIQHAARTRMLDIEELKDRIEGLDLRLRDESRIRSLYSGRVLELSVSSGQMVQQGMRLATIAENDSQARLKNIAYFKIRDGKRIRKGDRILVTPSNVERERFGSIVGTVEKEPSVFPMTRQGAINDIGSEEIVEALMSSGGAIEVEAELAQDLSPDSISGFQWTSRGPDQRFSAGTTTMVRVIVEQRRPITYVIPMLKTWLFGGKDDGVPQI
jgi:HlyD family secretion protein